MDLKELRRSDVEGGGGRHPWERARFSAVFSIVEQYAGTATARFFDIGCGDAYFIKRLATQLPQASFVGVDAAFDTATLARLAEGLAGKNIQLFQSVDAIPRTMLPADVVFLMDVLEHIEDDKAFLSLLEQKGIIGPKTRLVITVPAFQQLFSSHDVWLGHYRRHTVSTLRALADAGSYQIILSSYLFASLLVPRVLQVLFERLLPRRQKNVRGIGAWRERRVIDGCIAGMLRLDARALLWLSRRGIRVPGLSCVVVLEKKEKHPA